MKPNTENPISSKGKLMSLVIVETLLDEPITFDQMNKEEERLIPCLVVRRVKWRYSLLSGDRQRMICTYDAPDAESVRTGYQRADVFFSRIWAGEMLEPENSSAQASTALRIVMEVISPAGSQVEWNELQRKLVNNFSEQGIEWLKAYRSLDGTTMILELYAPDEQSVQMAQQQINIPCNRIWSAELLNPEIWASLGFSMPDS